MLGSKGRAFAVAAIVALGGLLGSGLAPAPATAVEAVATPGIAAGLPAAVTANPGDFDPGFIISDAEFFDGAAMSEADIQAFLERMAPSCAQANGQPCLKNYRTDSYSRAAVGANHCGAYVGAANERASTIIAKVAQTCGISPKVLLVLLQKEQGLVTSGSPTERAYRVATGYGCPDTAPCAVEFYGFYNQVYKAAWQFRQYLINASSRQYRIGAVPVQWHPNTACGSSIVNIRNQATANLYLYTPYQPNGAAMANLYGTGDACSSYGNRNFWRFYTDWFGSTGTIGYLAIDRAYARWGGATGSLGAAIGSPNPITANGGGLVQAYERGAIAWSASRGAFAVTGDIRAYFNQLGGIGGSFGWPASDPVVHAVGTVQSYAGGAILQTAEGVVSITGTMRTYFNATGGLAGPLGWPVAEQDTSAGITSQAFTGGNAYLRSGYMSRWLTPSTDAAWKAAGGATGPLGWPATEPLRFADNGGGYVQGFPDGALAAADGADAYLLQGNLRIAYGLSGGTAGPLGWPTSAGTCTAGICTQAFQKGDTFWSAATGGRFSVDPISNAYLERGGPLGTLGFPVTGLLSYTANSGGTVQGFEQGAMASSSAGIFVLTGGLRTSYGLAGGTTGALGWPTADQTCDPSSVCSQTFQNGITFWSAANGSAYSLAPISTAYLASGGAAGPLGWPATGSIAFAANGGGTVQGFERGAMASSAAGVFAISGGIRDFYNTQGGVGGVLGWPTAAMTCSGSDCSQQFQGGRVLYSPSTGGRIG